MKTKLPMAFQGSSSAPVDFSSGSGAGSVLATIISQGVVVSKYTPQGSMRPFGQDTGTADDNTIVESEVRASYTLK